jgi:formylglycine-generating enzyme required for sulfatase activity
LVVTGGTYYRTYDPPNPDDGGVETAADGGPIGRADPATVSRFKLDKYQVTVGRFRQFVNAWSAGYVPPPGSGKHTHLNGGRGLVVVGADAGSAYEPGWLASDDGNITPTSAALNCVSPYSTWTSSAGAHENLPIECVSWLEAYAFCIWDGGFLPSDAEWGYAVAGGSEQRVYPWGSAPPGTTNRYAIYNCHYPDGSGKCVDVSNLAPVGYAAQGAGRWGQLDLAGNVWQWNLDWSAPYANPCVDCANLTEGSNRVMRGGDFGYAGAYLPSASRNGYSPPLRAFIGFRCARAP